MLMAVANTFNAMRMAGEFAGTTVTMFGPFTDEDRSTL